MMSESKAPDFDTYGLLRATHSHNPTQYSHIVGLSPTYEQAHVGLDLLTLVSSKSEDSTSFYVVLRKEAELMGDVRRAGFVNAEKCVEEGAGEDETDI